MYSCKVRASGRGDRAAERGGEGKPFLEKASDECGIESSTIYGRICGDGSGIQPRPGDNALVVFQPKFRVSMRKSEFSGYKRIVRLEGDKFVVASVNLGH